MGVVMIQVVTVTFQVKPEHCDSFREAILANAASSLENEPGCCVFDVSETPGGMFFLYEVYRDQAAFDRHLTTPHFGKFDAASAPWIMDKKFVPYELISKAPARKMEVHPA
jgi:autoinducer 2-degrading protein